MLFEDELLILINFNRKVLLISIFHFFYMARYETENRDEGGLHLENIFKGFFGPA